MMHHRDSVPTWIILIAACVLIGQSPSAAQHVSGMPITTGVVSAMPGGHVPPPATPQPTTCAPLAVSVPGSSITASNTVVSFSGSSITCEDIKNFDDRWMTQQWHDVFIAQVHQAFWTGYDSYGKPLTNVVWGVGDYLAAMARMYELTRSLKYLDELREFANLVLAGRDDHIDLQPEPAPQFNPAFKPNPPSRADGLRGGRVMPAWGYRAVDYGGYHSSDLAVAGMYAYPIATFARIVAEDPALYARYGADAQAATTAILEMLEAFRPELHDQSLNPQGENYFAQPLGLRLLTPDQCNQGLNAAMQTASQVLLKQLINAVNASDYIAAFNLDQTDFQSAYTYCINSPQRAGFPLAHNEYQVFVMVLIELSRALDSDLYLNSLPPCQPAVLVPAARFFDETQHRFFDVPAHWSLPPCERRDVQGVARNIIPAIVAGAQGYYRHRWQVAGPADSPYFLWHYLDDAPPRTPHDLDDVHHGAIEMEYLGLLWRNKDRINALLAPNQIELDEGDMLKLANTFLEVIVRTDKNGTHTLLAQDLTGTLPPLAPPGQPPSYPDLWDDQCTGWLNLAEFNSLVYSKCETTTLSPSLDGFPNDDFAYSAAQPHLRIGNHSFLLAMKQFRP